MGSYGLCGRVLVFDFVFVCMFVFLSVFAFVWVFVLVFVFVFAEGGSTGRSVRCACPPGRGGGGRHFPFVRSRPAVHVPPSPAV
eukprot:NODE_6979_length_424_cov_90.888000_g5363_i0.p5 GENE.NODE_6979_length_424_cov_90.888000_g5363_i0~~NODE_6979_length_424_cov_90.888000_g5363_i0.p5  ORF type:complete len:84 (+),score=3.96 NODE_6979_length_424_cov_90.888000_g5363_i0:33-284(+)